MVQVRYRYTAQLHLVEYYNIIIIKLMMIRQGLEHWCKHFDGFHIGLPSELCMCYWLAGWYSCTPTDHMAPKTCAVVFVDNRWYCPMREYACRAKGPDYSIHEVQINYYCALNVINVCTISVTRHIWIHNIEHFFSFWQLVGTTNNTYPA